MFIDSACYLERVKSVINDGSEVKAAIAFLGDGAERLFKDAGKSVRIICNLLSGATNPKAVEGLLALGKTEDVQIRHLPDLHAKVIISREKGIVGSANLSTNGLCLEGNESAKWREAGYLVSDVQEIERMQSWFDRLWSDARGIEARDLKVANDLWERRKAIGRESLRNISLLAHRPEELEGRGIYVALYNRSPTKEAETAFQEERNSMEVSGSPGDANFTDKVSYFEDWSDLPQDAPLLSLRYSRQHKLKNEGAWRRIARLDFAYLPGDHETQIQVVVREPDVLRAIYGSKEAKQLATLLQPVLPKLLADADECGSICIRLDKALAIARAG
ncbi:phospholipase D family protein [Cupriavidus sp. 8B]